MAILNDPVKIRELLKKIENKNISIPCFCSENTWTTEGILLGAAEFAESSRLNIVPVYIAATANYHGREQLQNYTFSHTTEEGYLAFKSDLERLCRENGPFSKVLVIPSLDHGQPKADDSLFEQGKDFWGCVMYDCSTLPLEQNRKKTAEFVKKFKDHYIIEGCVDEITESGENDTVCLTEPADAEIFLKETEVDLLVVNLGTEHRATSADRKYHGDLAREIQAKVGNKLVLHGTSSLTQKDIDRLRNDGIIKVNIWTILEIKAAQKLAEETIKNIDRILPKETIIQLADQGWLGQKALEKSKDSKPQLQFLTEVYRRDKIKVPQVSLAVQNFLNSFGYYDFT